MSAPVLFIDSLTVRFTGDPAVTAVDNIDLQVRRGQTVALVGESGSGKSVTGLSIMRLLESPPAEYASGKIVFRDPASDRGVDLLSLSDRELVAYRGRRMGMVFQDPQGSLNPVLTVGRQVAEMFTLHDSLDRRESMRRALGLLGAVEFDDPVRIARQYPHELSGGMQQRVVIAMAAAAEPCLLIADEPTTALDVTTQSRVLRLLCRMQSGRPAGLLLITHDFAIVADHADYTYVLYRGRVVEHGPTGLLLRTPSHPYTQGLLSCLPQRGLGGGKLGSKTGFIPRPSGKPEPRSDNPRHFVVMD